ncbi:major facilitator superfamily domain-containing protein [Staphylotrichum tortipilum]|uniref:Major facilitator superfamily domain-containing protein n=1 Tax=Staphylotrichum tortipilum TaxID=2831512 RepID=A0AAN6RRR1_9PEZI|nr:major facilitator superfamily domain-containing protein [Staphylotrichum longicolle]
MEGSRLEKGPAPDAEWAPGKKEYAVMATLAIISLMVALDATILVSVLPALAVDLGGTATDAFWAGTSYLLSCAVCQPFIAALSDIFGRKELLVSSVFLFTLGTILCAPIAKNFPVFFVGRSIQGIGGGGIITMGQVIFADIVPLRQRPKYFSFVLGAWALGSVLGPLIGGLFVEHATWAWCFYLNFPFCAIGLVLIPIYIKLTTSKSSLMSKLSRVDWVGGLFFIGGMTSFLIGISWAGIQFAWKSAQAIAPMVVGIIAVIVSVIWEKHGAQEPFLRPSLFNSVSALATYACALFQGFILFCALYYIPFFFTAIRFKSPTNSGLDIFPVTCFLLPSSIIISLVTTRIGRYRWAIWSGWAITSVGCGLLVLMDTHTRTAIWAVILAVFGIGHGMLLTSVNIGIQAVSHVEDADRAAAMYAFMRTLGMAIGVAIGGTVFQNVMLKKLNKLGLPAAIAHDAEAYVKNLAQMDPDDPQRVATISGYLAGFRGVFWTITGAAIASFVISLIIRRYSMDKLLETKFRLKGARNPLPPSTGAPSHVYDVKRLTVGDGTRAGRA